MRYTIDVYQTDTGKLPFNEWLLDLSDIQMRQIIRTGLARLEQGNFGNCEPVASGIRELKFDTRPGYRIYFSVISRVVVLLLCAGSKRTQSKDIEKAKEYLSNFKMRGLRHVKSTK